MQNIFYKNILNKENIYIKINNYFYFILLLFLSNINFKIKFST
jgi:hypothetical protein